MKQKRLLLFFIIALLPGVFISCHDDDDDLIGLWEKKAYFSNSPRFGAASFTLDGKGYLLGGFADQESLKDVWVYDINYDRWDPIKKENEDPNTLEPVNFPGYARHRAVAAGCEYNKKGYYGLGTYSDYDDQTLSRDGEEIPLETTQGRLWDWWEFDPAGNNGEGKWRRLPDFPKEARHSAIAFCIENKIYVGTGNSKEVGNMNDIYAYNVDTDTWETVHIGYPKKAVGASVFVIDKVAYIVAGVDNEYNFDFYSFDPSQSQGNQWTTLRTIKNDTDEDYDDDYTTIHRAYGNSFVIDGHGYITCGSNGSLNRTTWKYIPRVDLWEEVRKFKGTGRQEAVSFSTGEIKGAIVTTGGTGSNTQYYDDTWNFDPYTWDDDDF